MKNGKTFYELYDIDKNATKPDIKSKLKTLYNTYKKKETQATSDGEKKKYTEKLTEINDASDTLLNDKKRVEYDQKISNPFGDSFGGGQSGGFNPFGGGFGNFEESTGSSFFDSFFSNAQSGETNRGNDVQHSIDVSLEEILTGSSKKIHYHRNVRCDGCDGFGVKTNAKEYKCQACKGSGIYTSFFGPIMNQRTCLSCKGSGYQGPKCSQCKGNKYIIESSEEVIQIPAGIEEHNKIRFRGKGYHGIGGGADGDLIIKINISKHSKFRRDGKDLYITLDIDVLELIKNKEISIQDIEKNTISVNIKSGSQPFIKGIRIDGKGLPSLKDSHRGDLYIELKALIDWKKEIRL